MKNPSYTEYIATFGGWVMQHAPRKKDLQAEVDQLAKELGENIAKLEEKNDLPSRLQKEQQQAFLNYLLKSDIGDDEVDENYKQFKVKTNELKKNARVLFTDQKFVKFQDHLMDIYDRVDTERENNFQFAAKPLAIKNQKAKPIKLVYATALPKSKEKNKIVRNVEDGFNNFLVAAENKRIADRAKGDTGQVKREQEMRMGAASKAYRELEESIQKAQGDIDKTKVISYIDERLENLSMEQLRDLAHAAANVAIANKDAAFRSSGLISTRILKAYVAASGYTPESKSVPPGLLGLVELTYQSIVASGIHVNPGESLHDKAVQATANVFEFTAMGKSGQNASKAWTDQIEQALEQAKKGIPEPGKKVVVEPSPLQKETKGLTKEIISYLENLEKSKDKADVKAKKAAVMSIYLTYLSIGDPKILQAVKMQPGYPGFLDAEGQAFKNRIEATQVNMAPKAPKVEVARAAVEVKAAEEKKPVQSLSEELNALIAEMKTVTQTAKKEKENEEEFVRFQKNTLDPLEEKYQKLSSIIERAKEEKTLAKEDEPVIPRLEAAHASLDVAITAAREEWANPLAEDFEEVRKAPRLDAKTKQILGLFEVYATEQVDSDAAQDKLFEELGGENFSAADFDRVFSNEKHLGLVSRALNIRENSDQVLAQVKQIQNNAATRAVLVDQFDKEIKKAKKNPDTEALLKAFLSYIKKPDKPRRYNELDSALSKLPGLSDPALNTQQREAILKKAFANLSSEQRTLIEKAAKFHKAEYFVDKKEPSKTTTLSTKISTDILAKYPAEAKAEKPVKPTKQEQAFAQIAKGAMDNQASLGKSKNPFVASVLGTPPIVESRNQLRKLEKALQTAKKKYNVSPADETYQKAQAAIQTLKNNIEALEAPKKAFAQDQIRKLQNLKEGAQALDEKAEIKTQIRTQAANAMKNIRSLRKFDAIVSKGELAAARKNIKSIDKRYKEVKKTLKKEIEAARKESMDVELSEAKVSAEAPPPPPVFDDSALKQQYEDNIGYLKSSFNNKDSAELAALSGVLLSDAKEVAKQVEPGSAAEEKVVKQWLLDIKGQVRVLDQIAALKALENRSLQGFNEAQKAAQKYKENPNKENAAELTRIEEKAKDLESATEMHRDLIIEYSKGVRMDSREKDKFVRNVIRLQGNCSVHVSEIVSEIREARSAPLKKTEAKIETQVDKDLAQLKIYHKEMQDIALASKASPSETADKLAQGYIREAKGLLVLIETETGKGHDEARALVNSIVKMQREVTPQNKKSSTAMFLSAVHADPKVVEQGIKQNREEAKKVAEPKKPKEKPKTEDLKGEEDYERTQRRHRTNSNRH